MKFRAFDPIDMKNGIEVGIVTLKIENVIPDKNQPRKHFDNQSMEELSLSIKQYGVIQPIIVKKLAEDKYQIIAGERRWRASCLVGLKEIPAIIKNEDNQNNIAISLIENIQRQELNPIELAESFYALNTIHGLSHEMIATMVGKQRATVTNLLRLLNLGPYVKERLINGKLEMGHAKLLIPLDNEDQILFVNKIIEEHLTVRDAEKLIQLHKAPKNHKVKHSVSKNIMQSRKVEEWAKALSQCLPDSRATVKMNERGEGKLILYFSSPGEAETLIEKICFNTHEEV